MILFLLDTDHVSLQERGHPPLRARLATGATSSAYAGSPWRTGPRGNLLLDLRKPLLQVAAAVRESLQRLGQELSRLFGPAEGEERPHAPVVDLLSDRLEVCALVVTERHRPQSFDPGLGRRPRGPGFSQPQLRVRQPGPAIRLPRLFRQGPL